MLLSRAFEYLKSLKKYIYKYNHLPDYITLFVTNRCNAECKHCFYWEDINKKVDELSLEEINTVSENMHKFPFLLITGGEPTLRDDLPEIVELFYRNNNVRKMNIMTNGMLTEKTIGIIKKIYSTCPELYLSLFVSLDDIEERHDAIRGIQGIYKKAAETIKKLKALNIKNLTVGVAMTYSTYNESKVIDIYNKIKEDLKPDTFNCAYVRGDSRNKTAKNCDINNYIELQNLINKDVEDKNVKGVSDPLLGNLIAAAKFKLIDLVVKTVKEDRYLSPCYAGIINAVIYPDGDVFPCELLSDKMGNLRDYNYDFKKLWNSKESDAIRKKIKENKCYCTHECNLLPNILYNPGYTPAVISGFIKLLIKRMTKKSSSTEGA